MLTRDKILGMLVGGAIGDAWGMGVETWTPEKIKEVHPNGVPEFVAPIGHKWFDAEKHPPGTTTDDTPRQWPTACWLRSVYAGCQAAACFTDH